MYLRCTSHNLYVFLHYVDNFACFILLMVYVFAAFSNVEFLMVNLHYNVTYRLASDLIAQIMMTCVSLLL